MMNRAQLVAAIAKDVGGTKSSVDRVLGSLITHVTRMLKKGERVTFVGFGTFVVSRRRTRLGRDPRSGAVIKIPGRRVPRFAPGSELKDAVK
jgi:DNA-binding protein HU-beta